jgi:hypothetical protein
VYLRGGGRHAVLGVEQFPPLHRDTGPVEYGLAQPLLSGIAHHDDHTRSRCRAGGAAGRLRAQWLRHDVLTLGGPDLATRRELFDLITDELEHLELEDA